MTTPYVCSDSSRVGDMTITPVPAEMRENKNLCEERGREGGYVCV